MSKLTFNNWEFFDRFGSAYDINDLRLHMKKHNLKEYYITSGYSKRNELKKIANMFNNNKSFKATVTESVAPYLIDPNGNKYHMTLTLMLLDSTSKNYIVTDKKGVKTKVIADSLDEAIEIYNALTKVDW